MEINQEWKNQISGVWSEFIETGKISDTSLISLLLADSWKKCRRNGLDPYIKRITVACKGPEFENLLKNNKELLLVSRPFMTNLYSFVKGSGFLTALFDPRGYLIETIGDENITASSKAVNFCPGVLWDEETAGTSAISLVLEHDMPVQVRSAEHYMHLAHLVSACAASIHDPGGKLIGGLLMAGPYKKIHPHTLGMVVAAANAIENYLQVRRTLIDTKIAYSFQRTVIGSIPEALIAVDYSGRISLINQRALEKLALTSDSIGKNIKSAFGRNTPAFLNLFDAGRNFTDIEVNISRNEKNSHYLMTCKSIISPDDEQIGRIYIFTEMARTKELVTKMIGAKANFHFSDIIGDHPHTLKTIALGQKAAQTRSTVLLLGESGTGKNIFAQAIHNESGKAGGPFVAINCAAIPRELIASELFGYAEGSFTGSRRGGNHGKFELAEGGTIFLDEIGEMPLDLQTTLLNVIEDKRIVRIGGKEVINVDVRIIASTNRNLKEAIKNGHFREDLYYRLNVFTIEMVPLRERKSDILPLAEHFIEMICNNSGVKRIKIDPKARKLLINYSWPGNVRELQNVIERSIHIAKGSLITEDILPQEIKSPYLFLQDNSNISSKEAGHQLIHNMINNYSQIEHQFINNLINNCSKIEIAEKLNISRSTLYRRLKAYNIPKAKKLRKSAPFW